MVPSDPNRDLQGHGVTTDALDVVWAAYARSVCDS